MKRLSYIIGVCAGALLTACSSSSEKTYCPHFALISELDRLPITTPLTSQGEIRITQIAAHCDDHSLELRLQARLSLPLNDETTIEREIPYFIAVVDDKENVIKRRDLTFKVKLKGPEEVHIYKQNYKIPSEFDWERMRMLVGLTLTPEQRQQNILVKTHQQQLMNSDMNTQQREKVKRLSVQ